MIESSPALRILSPRAVLEGSGNPSSVENINPTQLPDGCLVWVQAEAALYRYDSTSVSSRAYPDICPTTYGEGVPGRWRRCVTDAVPATAVNCCATADVNLALPQVSFDGHVLVDNDRVLLPFQTDQTENGIYSWSLATGLLTRAADFDQGSDFVTGTIVSVNQGTIYAGADFRLLNTGVVVLGVTPILFGLSSGILLVDRFGITIARHDQLQIKGAYASAAGQANIVDTLTLNAKEFGVVGDGVADDTLLMQAAFNAAISSGLPLYIPPGTYLITGVLTIDSGVSANVVVFGANTGGTQLVGSGAGNAVVELRGSSLRLIMRDIYINGSTTKVHALSVIGTLTTDTVLENIRLAPGSTSNFSIEATAQMLSSRISGMTCSGGKYGIYAPDITNVQNVKFYGCRISNTGSGDSSGACIYSRNPTAGQPNLEFYGCTFEGNNGRVLDHLGGCMIRFFGGHVENNNKTDTTYLRGEFEIGGGYLGNTTQAHLLLNCTRIGEQFGSHDNPRVRVTSTHTQVALRDTNWIAGYRISCDAGTATGSQIQTQGLPVRVLVNTSGAFRVIQEPQPCGETQISDANSSAVVNVGAWMMVSAQFIPIMSVIATTGAPAAGSTRCYATARTLGSLGAIVKSGAGPVITNAAAPEASVPNFSNTFILEIMGGGIRGVATARYSQDGGGAWSGNFVIPTNGRIRLSNGVRLDCPAGTYLIGETYTATATTTSFTANLEAAPGVGSSVTVGWTLQSIPS